MTLSLVREPDIAVRGEIPFTAACPGCGGDAEWVELLMAELSSVQNSAGIAYTKREWVEVHSIDCLACDAVEESAA